MDALDLGDPLFDTFDLRSNFVELEKSKEVKSMSEILQLFTSSRNPGCKDDVSRLTVVDCPGTG